MMQTERRPVHNMMQTERRPVQSFRCCCWTGIEVPRDPQMVAGADEAMRIILKYKFRNCRDHVNPHPCLQH